MCWYVYDPALCSELLAQWLPGNGIRIASNALWCSGAGWKRCDGSCCSEESELHHGMYGKSVCMDRGNCPSYCTLLLCNEGYEKEIVPVKQEVRKNKDYKAKRKV